eukprot:3198986-Pyramimonas_sp.AAC.1
MRTCKTRGPNAGKRGVSRQSLAHQCVAGRTQSPRSLKTGEGGEREEGRGPGGRVRGQLAERGRHRGDGVQVMGKRGTQSPA